MFSVDKCTLPEDSLLRIYERKGAYTDCYKAEIGGTIEFAEFVERFYTSPLFKTERCILKWLVSKPSSDAEAQELANGQREIFAAWHVEDRSPNQILMCDYLNRTRSWLMSTVLPNEGPLTTRLYFGSAVVPARSTSSGQESLGFIFHALLGFHEIYSSALLASARAQLQSQR